MQNDKDGLGILVYGFNSDNTHKIKSHLDEAFQKDIFVYSASGMENKKLMEILETEPSKEFIDNATKILVFLGFDDNDINQALKALPPSTGIPRPIFCGLTEQNIKWTFSMLIEHLVEEDQYWKNQKE